MKLLPIRTFADFCADLLTAGFAMGGGNDEGVFSLAPWMGEHLRYHTGDPETDPWVWRIRAVTERTEFAYGQFFLGKSGWITREWLPRFIAVRRRGRSMEELYADGLVPRLAKTLYQRIREAPHCHMVQLRAALEGFLRRGIEAVSLFDREYPERLKRRMGNLAPPILFLSGDRALLEMPMIGVFGISGVKTTQEVRSSVEALVRGAKERGRGSTGYKAGG